MSPQRGRTRAVLDVALCVGAFLVVSTLLRANLPRPLSCGLRAKWGAFLARGDDLQGVFVGSSHLQSGVVPDRVAARINAEDPGARTSFNFGVAGLVGYEADLLLDEILAQGLPDLKWIVIELSGWQPGHHAIYPVRRNVRWHDPERTAAAIRAELEDDAPWSLRLQRVWGHVALYGLWVTQAGTLHELMLESLSPPGSHSTMPYGKEDGYLDLAEFRRIERTSRRAFLRDRQAVERQLAEGFAAASGPGVPRPWDARGLARQTARAHAAGIELFHVVPPLDKARPEFAALREAAPPHLRARIWDFNDPRERPELFALEARYDVGHLSRVGAERLSDLIASRLTEALRGPGPP